MKKSLSLINSINSFCFKNQLVKPDQNLLISISGGQDSIVLFFIFFILKKQLNVKISTIYCNHLWHPNSIYTFLHLSKICYILETEFSYAINVNGASSEQLARNWRLKNYLRVINFFAYNSVLTGHTESDSSETFLFNLIRGSGVTGISALKEKKKLRPLTKNEFKISDKNLLFFEKLKRKELKKKIFTPIKKRSKQLIKNYCYPQNNGIPINLQSIEKKFFIFRDREEKPISILRPLLKYSRFDIYHICRTYRIPVFPDLTNQKKIYTRNRLRKQILPTLRFFFNPKVDGIFSKYNNIISTQDDILEKFVKNIFTEVVFDHQNFYSINFSLLYAFPIGIQRKLCILFFQKKIFIQTNFYSINLFLLLVKQQAFYNTKKNISISKLGISTQSQAVKKSINLNTGQWVFFPQIGVIFIYEQLLTFIK